MRMLKNSVLCNVMVTGAIIISVLGLLSSITLLVSTESRKYEVEALRPALCVKDLKQFEGCFISRRNEKHNLIMVEVSVRDFTCNLWLHIPPEVYERLKNMSTIDCSVLQGLEK